MIQPALAVRRLRQDDGGRPALSGGPPRTFARRGRRSHSTRSNSRKKPYLRRPRDGIRILAVNGNDGFIVEITLAGHQVATRLLDKTGTPPGSGTLFGRAVATERNEVYFIDDGTNTRNLLH